MAGLLDFLTTDPDQQRAITQGLLSGAFGAMAGRGSRLQAWGQGGLAGLQGYSNSLDRTAMDKQQAAQLQRQKLLDQLTQYQVQQAQREGQIAALPQQFATPARIDPQMDARDIGTPGAAPTIPAAFDTQGYLAALRGIDPMRAMQMEAAMQKQVPTPIKLGQGETLVDPQTFKPLANNPKAADLPNTVQEYQFAVQQGYKGTFDQWDKERKRAGASSVTVGYGAPVAGVDPTTGNPLFFQPSKDGKTPPAIIKGVAPPGQKLGEAAAKQVAGIDALSGAVDEYVNTLTNWKKTDALSPDKRAAMGTAYNNMMLQAKEAYNLGVLNGPDYQILQSVVRDPTSPMSTFISNDALGKQAIQLRQMMQKTRSAVINQHGGKAAPGPASDAPVRKFNPVTGRIE